MKTIKETYTAYELVKTDGTGAYFLDDSGDGFSCTPEQFSEETGISLESLKRHIEEGRELWVHGFDVPFKVDCFEVDPNPRLQDELLADLYDATVRLH